MDLNNRFDQIRQSATVAVADRVLALKAQGRKIIPLQVGDPDFSTPEPVVNAAIDAMKGGLTHYGPSRGFLELRQAISDRINDQGSLASESSRYDPASEILVTHGAIHAYYLALQSILNPEDEVMIPDPSWATHVNMVKMLGGSVIRVPASAENNFIPPIEAWKKLITAKTKAIVINYPANPTGAFPTRGYLQELLDFASSRSLWVVSDEVYQNLYYGDRPVSAGAFPERKNRVLLVNSLSKTYAMTGWRVGYLAAPQHVIDHALKAGQNSITCLAPFIQKAAYFALTDEAVQVAAVQMRDTYAKRRALVLQIADEFSDSPVKVQAPMGAFYFFLDFRQFGLPSVEICENILNQAGVGLVPGSAFGPAGEGFIRMTIAASIEDVEAGFRAILNWADQQVGG